MKPFAAAVLIATLTSTASAGTQAQLLLKGVVQPVLDISVQAEAVAESLDLSRPANNVKVATVTEKSNYATGYKVLAKSTNGMKLVNNDDANSSVQYNLSYGGNNLSIGTSPSQIYHTANLKGTYTKEVKVSFNQPSNLTAGTYQDTIQFTIEAN